MATLSGKTTRGTTCWDFYVRDDPNHDGELVVSRDWVLRDGAGKAVGRVSAGDVVRVAARETRKVSGAESALVSAGGCTGWLSLNSIVKPSGRDPVAHERVACDAINEMLVQARPEFITLPTGITPLGGIVACVRVDRDLKAAAGLALDPKADLILVSNTVAPLSGNAVFLSHKRAGGASSFHHYSGVSRAAGEGINGHEEVVDFLDRLSRIVESERLQGPVFRPISNTTLACRAIFGPEFGVGANAHSLQHVHAIVQGNPLLSTTANVAVMRVDFTDHCVGSGNTEPFTGDYAPVLAAFPRNGRGYTHRGTRYDGVRLLVCPYSTVRGRSGLREAA